MSFQLKDVLSAAGPTASLIFAAWIFLSFLQARYSGAYDRYRALVSELREKHDPGQLAPERRRSIVEQIKLYKSRCEQMRTATNIGVTSAIILIAGVITGTIGLAVPDVAVLKYITVGALILGLVLVIAAASFVLAENTSIQRAIDGEVEYLPEFKPR